MRILTQAALRVCVWCVCVWSTRSGVASKSHCSPRTGTFERRNGTRDGACDGTSSRGDGAGDRAGDRTRPVRCDRCACGAALQCVLPVQCQPASLLPPITSAPGC